MAHKIAHLISYNYNTLGDDRMEDLLDNYGYHGMIDEAQITEWLSGIGMTAHIDEIYEILTDLD